MIYDNSLEKCNEFSTPEGSPYEDIYSVKVLKDGTCVLEVTGKKNVQDEINAWKEHTDMSYILRAMATGQYMPRDNIMYGDFTQTPETLSDALQTIINAEKAFYELPLEMRNKFDNDWKKWMVMANSETEKFMDMMEFKKENNVVEVEKEGDE